MVAGVYRRWTTDAIDDGDYNAAITEDVDSHVTACEHSVNVNRLSANTVHLLVRHQLCAT